MGTPYFIDNSEYVCIIVVAQLCAGKGRIMSTRRKRDRRDQPVVVYLRDDEKENLKELAERADKTMSDIMRDLLLSVLNGRKG